MASIYRFLFLLSGIFFSLSAEAGSLLHWNQEKEEPQQEEYCIPTGEECCLPCGLLTPVRFCDCPSPFIGSVTFLYWQAKMAGLEFGAKNNGPIEEPLLSFHFNTRVYTPDFAWQPGWKIEIGYHSCYDDWDTRIRWAYFHSDITNAKKNIRDQLFPPGQGVIPLWYFPHGQYSDTTPILYTTAKSDWGVLFDTIDWEFGRFFHITCQSPWLL